MKNSLRQIVVLELVSKMIWNNKELFVVATSGVARGGLYKIAIEKCNKNVWVYLFAAPRQSEHFSLYPPTNFCLAAPASSYCYRWLLAPAGQIKLLKKYSLENTQTEFCKKAIKYSVP